MSIYNCEECNNNNCAYQGKNKEITEEDCGFNFIKIEPVTLMKRPASFIYTFKCPKCGGIDEQRAGKDPEHTYLRCLFCDNRFKISGVIDHE